MHTAAVRMSLADARQKKTITMVRVCFLLLFHVTLRLSCFFLLLIFICYVDVMCVCVCAAYEEREILHPIIFDLK